MIAMFCGVLNCPIASIVLSIELFGSKALYFCHCGRCELYAVGILWAV